MCAFRQGATQSDNHHAVSQEAAMIMNLSKEERTSMAKKYVYLFTEGNAGMRNLLGGKGANLAEMTNIGLPVPQEYGMS